jgi:hypothetical protein
MPAPAQRRICDAAPCWLVVASRGLGLLAARRGNIGQGAAPLMTRTPPLPKLTAHDPQTYLRQAETHRPP